jgi:hypothetical protein
MHKKKQHRINLNSLLLPLPSFISDSNSSDVSSFLNMGYITVDTEPERVQSVSNKEHARPATQKCCSTARREERTSEAARGTRAGLGARGRSATGACCLSLCERARERVLYPRDF